MKRVLIILYRSRYNGVTVVTMQTVILHLLDCKTIMSRPSSLRQCVPFFFCEYVHIRVDSCISDSSGKECCCFDVDLY